MAYITTAVAVLGLMFGMLKYFESRMDKRFDQFEVKIDRRFEQVDRRFEQVDRKFELVDQKLEVMNERIFELALAVHPRVRETREQRVAA